MKNIAVDIGKKKCVVCIMDENGTILDETSFDNTLNDASLFAEQTMQRYQKCQAVCESTDNLWIKTHVANKMMTIMWHMLTTKTQYMQQNTNLYQKKLKKIDKTSSH